MSGFQFREIYLSNYRCFEELTLSLEDDVTVLFAENGGGKTALLTALASGLAVIQQRTRAAAGLDVRRDPRLVTLDDRRREPAGWCELRWTATVGDAQPVWSTAVNPAVKRARHNHRPIFDAIGPAREQGARWPLFAWYGVDRLGRASGRRRRVERTGDRWEGYESSLNPSLDEAPLLQWLQDEMLGDAARRRQGERERFLDVAVMDATARATPRVSDAWYDPATQAPTVRFENGEVATWAELSDGYHVYIALVADIARRAVMLNEMDGPDAPERIEGVVLIDELDLHLHPGWQRIALPGLRKAFPRLQFVISTHSPQVLSSARNRQVRLLVDGQLWKHDVFVDGRDSNAILRDLMDTEDRDLEGAVALKQLHEAINKGDRLLAEQLHGELAVKWGVNDPALIRARGYMEE